MFKQLLYGIETKNLKSEIIGLNYILKRIF